MREMQKEERMKQARSNKQQGKATQHTTQKKKQGKAKQVHTEKFFVGGVGGLFWNSEIDKKHSSLWGVWGGMPPKNVQLITYLTLIPVGFGILECILIIA